jgi:ABC-type sugar transport system permease subunit
MPPNTAGQATARVSHGRASTSVSPAGQSPAGRPLAARTGARRRWRNAAPGYLFLLPSAAILLVFVVYPILMSLWMSLHDWSLFSSSHPFVGLGNYQAMLHDPRFWNALRNTAVYTAVVVPAQVGVGLALAVALQRNSLANKFLRSVFFFPVISALATMGIVWKFLLDPQIGVINHLLVAVGLPDTAFLQSTTWALPAVIAVGVWKSAGFSMVIYLAALQDIPRSVVEAAAVDGAGPWPRFWRITLPMLRQSTLFAVVMATITSMQLFDQVYVMTSGGPLFHTDTLVTYLYQVGFQEFRSGYAAAISWVLFLLILLVSMLQLRLFRFKETD